MAAVINEVPPWMWWAMLENLRGVSQFEGHLIKAAMCAEREQLDEMAVAYPHLITVIKEHRGMV